MRVKKLLSEDDAVSPVIGVILMVAITVILAAVIATFVLGLGEQVSQTAPQASFTFEFSESDDTQGRLSITHDGGDSIKAKNLYVRGQNGSANSGNFNDPWIDFVDGTIQNSLSQTADGSSSGEIGGESAVVGGDYIEFATGTDAKIRVVYEDQQGESSATLSTWEGPDA